MVKTTRCHLAAGLTMALQSLYIGSVSAISATSTVACDVAIAGGSTASLAAAITAATVAPTKTICLTDPTDWLGGQLTASAVSAIDFGKNRDPKYQPKSFRDLMDAIGSPSNPGHCWVSPMCYQPLDLINGYVNPTVKSLKNLKVYYNSVVKDISPCDSKSICNLTVIQRKMKSASPSGNWARNLSEAITDWYSPMASAWFDKSVISIKAEVFIDATEFGDVLIIGAANEQLKLPVTQGVEEPRETSDTTDDRCGQAATITFYIGVQERSSTKDAPVPKGNTEGLPFDIPNDGFIHPLPHPWKWDNVWTYRRSLAATPILDGAQLGDICQQNWGGGNDLETAYLFQPLDTAITAAQAGQHCGGINLTALSMLENRAFGWYHYYTERWNTSTSYSKYRELYMARNVSGTMSGLAKMPYLRDTRRSVGIHGFKMLFTDVSGNPGEYGLRYNDTVAIGSYEHDTHELRTCTLPEYIEGGTAKPYYIPFRALTSSGADNLLVAGKTMATSFSANSVTRLHPSEWTSGVAAGAAAALMTLDDDLKTTTAVFEKGLPRLNNILSSSEIDQPLHW